MGASISPRLRPLLVQTARWAAPYRLAGIGWWAITGAIRAAPRTVSDHERDQGPNASRLVGQRYRWLSQIVDAARA